MLDAISSGAATTPAALSAVLGLPKSSIADLLGTLEDTGFVARGADGSLRMREPVGPTCPIPTQWRTAYFGLARQGISTGTRSRWSNCSATRSSSSTSASGRHPLPLTPRPGQRANADACAGAVAILSSLSAAEAANAVWTAASHLGLSDDEVQRALTLRRTRRRAVYESLSPHMGRQLACPVTGTQFALTLHVPERWPERTIRKAARALNAAADVY